MRHGDQFGVQVDAIAELRRKRRREAIVAALDPVHVPRRRCRLRRQIDRRARCSDSSSGSARKNPRSPGRGRSQLLVGAHLVEPLGDRSASEVGGDRRIPPLLGESIGPDRVGEASGQPIPAAGRVAADDARLAGRVGPDVAEAAAQDARQLQPELLAEVADLVLRFVDQVAAGFGVLAFGEAVADGPDAAADAVARVDHGDVGAERQRDRARRRGRRVRRRRRGR